jgi:hypothetical protein
MMTTRERATPPMTTSPPACGTSRGTCHPARARTHDELARGGGV